MKESSFFKISRFVPIPIAAHPPNGLRVTFFLCSVRGEPFELAENSPQDGHVAVAEVGPTEDSPQGVHDSLGVVGVQKTDPQEESLQVVVHSLDLLELRQLG